MTRFAQFYQIWQKTVKSHLKQAQIDKFISQMTKETHKNLKSATKHKTHEGNCPAERLWAAANCPGEISLISGRDTVA